MNIHLRCLFFSLMTALSACGSKPTQTSTEIQYQGRLATPNTNAVVIIWQGTTIQSEFTGNQLQIGFAELSGQVYFDLTIDGETRVIKANNGWLDTPFTLVEGLHTISLFKRSEADVGHVSFLGFKTKPENSQEVAIQFNPPKPKIENSNHKKFLFFGDSITAGACNEDGAVDQWEDYSTHNNALSYGALTAETLNAEYRNISVSGMGISIGYNKLRFKEVWDRVYPDPNSDQIDFKQWQPDVIFINYGENDDAYTTNQGLPFPSDFISGYVSVVKKIRNAYPKSTIVILRGGMYGGSQSQRLRTPWENVVKTLEQDDSNIKHFVFDHWSSTHPRVSDHKAMAKELSEWVKTNL